GPRHRAPLRRCCEGPGRPAQGQEAQAQGQRRMTTLDGHQTPKTRAMPQNRTALIAALDIGTSKVACLIARLKPCPPSEALRGRSHAIELIGISHIQSLGVKAGAVVDLAKCEQSV